MLAGLASTPLISSAQAWLGAPSCGVTLHSGREAGSRQSDKQRCSAIHVTSTRAAEAGANQRLAPAHRSRVFPVAGVHRSARRATDYRKHVGRCRISYALLATMTTVVISVM
jgi:hypothetical protein